MHLALMRYALPCLLIAPGCKAWTGVQRDLLTQASRGVELVATSVNEQYQTLLAEHDTRRRRLDAAFMNDVGTRALIDRDWVIEAATAYAAATDALHERRRNLEQAHAADRANLAAIRAALAKLDWLLSLQMEGVNDGR